MTDEIAPLNENRNHLNYDERTNTSKKETGANAKTEKGFPVEETQPNDHDQEGENESTMVFDEHGNEVNHSEEAGEEMYDVDFNDYAEDEEPEESGNNEESDGSEDDDDDDADDEFDDSELILPDIGISRENTLASRLNGESGIFDNPRQPSMAYQRPSLQSLSQEILDGEEAKNDAEFTSSSSAEFVNGAPSHSAESTRTSTMTSDLTIDNHDEFVSKAKDEESIISYETDDAFSFMANDDKEYEIGYQPHGEDSGYSTEQNKFQRAEDDDLTDTESVRTENGGGKEEDYQPPIIPPVPHAPAVRDSVVIATRLESDVNAMRSAFVKENGDNDYDNDESSDGESDKGGNGGKKGQTKGLLTREVDGKDAPSKDFDTNKSLDSDCDKNIDTATDRTSTSTSTLSNSSDLRKKKSIQVNVTTFSSIPNTDLMSILSKISTSDEKISKLKEIRKELTNIETGLTDWISYNMGDSVKISKEDERLGPHVKEAIKLLDDGTLSGSSRNFAISDTVETVAYGLKVSKLKEAVKDVKVSKIGQRGKTLLRKFKKAPS